LGVKEEEGDTEDEQPWAGTALHGLMEEDLSQRRGGLLSIKREEAAGEAGRFGLGAMTDYGHGDGHGVAEKGTDSAEEETEEYDSDDLGAPAPKVVKREPDLPRVPSAAAAIMAESRRTTSLPDKTTQATDIGATRSVSAASAASTATAPPAATSSSRPRTEPSAAAPRESVSAPSLKSDKSVSFATSFNEPGISEASSAALARLKRIKEMRMKRQRAEADKAQDENDGRERRGSVIPTFL
jgi:hypothetical protein